ncbi:hypothetical protein PMIN03_012789 [Paraphaeosphaeria minitans]
MQRKDSVVACAGVVEHSATNLTSQPRFQLPSYTYAAVTINAARLYPERTRSSRSLQVAPLLSARERLLSIECNFGNMLARLLNLSPDSLGWLRSYPGECLQLRT